MIRRIFRATALSLLAGFVSVVGCADQSNPVGLDVGSPISNETAEPTYTLVQDSTAFDYTVSQQIGVAGGFVELGSFRIDVPAGAVTETTTFSLRVRGDGYVATSLHATRIGEDGQTVDVGAAGFLVPVLHTMPYDNRKIKDPSGLVIVWLKDGTYNGGMEAQPTAFSRKNSTVSAPLNHFSSYALAWP
jgi:hypothetical protein